MNSGRIWITWEIQRRNRTLSARLGSTLNELIFKGNRFLRYPALIARTAALIAKKRPSILFVQNPSIVLALFAVSSKFIFRSPVVVDAHNAGIFPFEGKKPWANRVTGFILRNADLTIVTNPSLAGHVSAAGGRPFALPDPLPEIRRQKTARPLKGRRNVLFICTYAEDEPYLEVIKAASMLAPDIFVYISGNPKGREKAFSHLLAPNTVLTGYLPEDDYIGLFNSVDAVVDLTTREDCLVCGAYEAVTLEKPMVLSDTKALRDYFSNGALFTDNTAGDLAGKIMEALENADILSERAKRLKETLAANWEEMKDRLEKTLREIEKK
ncbi:MAG: glycosyltransferase family 4 protein [Deltaproteobacteria bacterium]|nr:glycosyltransferase family 4 protein [Deltaproteobacteria bacterium]